MDRWTQVQTAAAAVEAPLTPVERDARAIHNLLFKSASKAKVIVMPASFSVTIGDDSEPVVVPAPRPATTPQVLAVTQDEARALWDSVTKLSGCAESRGRRLTQLWADVTGIEPDYCSGGFGTSDKNAVVQSIHFTNAERRRAIAVVSTGSGGHAPIVEKIDGRWKVTGSAGGWEY